MSVQVLHQRSSALRILAALTVVALLGACSEQDPLRSQGEDWLFINYWAIWCKPCRHEVPELNALHTQPGYSVFGVNFDGVQGEELAEQEAQLAIAFPTLAQDPRERFAVPLPEVLPTTLIVRPDGELHAVLVGPQTRESLLAAIGSVSVTGSPTQTDSSGD